MTDSQNASGRHAYMVDDSLRTVPLVAAIKKIVRPGMIVVDIGTGLGVLAIAAAEAGASKVYAIDCDHEALCVAAEAAEKKGLGDRIFFIEGLSFELEFEPSERADVLICETIGSFAFDENILATIKDAKKRFLKPAGKIIPQSVELSGVPLIARHKTDSIKDTGLVEESSFACQSKKLVSVDFKSNKTDHINIKGAFKINRNLTIKAVAVWPKIEWGRGFVTDASPLCSPTHWKQGILPVPDLRVEKDESVIFELIISPNPDNPLMMTERLWRVKKKDR